MTATSTMKTAAALFPIFLSVEADQSYYMEGTVTNRGYDSYATAWRYLGAYVDCGNGSRGGSYFSSGSSSFWNKCKYCRRLTRKKEKKCKGGTKYLLWAAYYDPNYSGGQIGDYQYYDASDGGWDASTCTGNRCAKMDCHDPYGSSWELTGVYKETVSFQDDNFFEQLFKHQGYCLWDGDKDENDYDSQDSDGWEDSTYGFMQSMRKELPEGCTQTDVFGGTYYIDMKPQEGGDMTLGVYTDSSCINEADLTYEDYQSYASSYLTSSASSGAFDTWNSGMDYYKICQPCRAYNREATEYAGSGDGDWQRQLGEQNDGQGDEEQNGFNCYDDAGYQNCNQCYKFETHSDMAQASSKDLSEASSQGTILRINYNGVWYGSGHAGDVGSSSSGYGSSYSSSSSSSSGSYYTFVYSFAGGGTALLALGGALFRARRRRGTPGDDVYVEMAEPR
ncbi:hypothetical protein ACHAWF_003857 [Thalassiosira exigua]